MNDPATVWIKEREDKKRALKDYITDKIKTDEGLVEILFDLLYDKKLY